MSERGLTFLASAGRVEEGALREADGFGKDERCGVIGMDEEHDDPVGGTRESKLSTGGNLAVPELGRGVALLFPVRGDLRWPDAISWARRCCLHAVRLC